MKILWHSNSPLVPTGYGVQTELFVKRLKDRHEMAISAFYGLEGAPIMWDDVPVFPSLGGEFGNQYIAGHAGAFFGGDPKGGLVFTLMDVLALSTNVYSGLHTACWTPVDHDPATPTQEQFFAASSAVPIAMSRYGQDRLEKFDPLYVPHGVETDIYRPMNRAEVRKKVGVGKDAFVVGMVAANKGNPSRKCFVEALTAFARLREKHENAVLYLHTEVSGQVSQGVPILEVAGSLGIPPDAMARADQYRLLFSPYPPEAMAAVYSAFDVLLAPSAGEGFGIPIMEAQACGTPVIVTDFSAMSEVAGSGWKVSGQKHWTGQESWQMTPNIDEIYEALEECYNLSTAEWKSLGVKAREHALQYDADLVFTEQLLPALKEIEERIGETPMIPAPTNGKIDVMGTKLHLDDNPSGGVVATVAQEIEKVYKLQDIKFKPGDEVVDCGAHVGTVSIYLAKTNPGIKVHAFEPLPENYERLVSNIKANGVEDQVVPFNLALTGDGRDLELVTHVDSNSGGASEFVVGEAAGEKVGAHSTTLDEVFEKQGIKRCKLLKLDCEGAEYEILSQAILDKVDYIRGEFHINRELERRGASPEALVQELTQALPGKDRVMVTSIRIAE